VAVTNDDELARKISKFQQDCGYPDDDWIKQQLAHPILMEKSILPYYAIGGKLLLRIFSMVARSYRKRSTGKKSGGWRRINFPKRAA